MRKLLHAEDLAKLAGVHKSTVLLAIRRGEMPASRTAGRSARIEIEDARAYLEQRGRPVPPELAAQAPLALGLVTDSADVVTLCQAVLPKGVGLLGDANLYQSLTQIGARLPQVIIVDLDMLFLNPIMLLRTLREFPGLRGAHLAGIGVRDDLFSAARSVGVETNFLKIRQEAMGAWVMQKLGEAVPTAVPTLPARVNGSH